MCLLNKVFNTKNLYVSCIIVCRLVSTICVLPLNNLFVCHFVDRRIFRRDLFDNQIEYLPDTVFDSLENLTNLWVTSASNPGASWHQSLTSCLLILRPCRKIHKNKLKVLDEKLFIANINLETLQVFSSLSLSLSCGFTTSFVDWKVNRWYLDWIRDLSNNELKEVPNGIFRTLRRLTVLHLSSNKLEQLDENLLRGQNQLEDIDLSRNELNELPPLLLDGDFTLKTLFYFSIAAETKSINLNLGCTKLKSIKFSNNHIKALPPGLFRGLSDVEVLQLQNNEIADLPERIFHDLGSLTQLVLTGNSIVRISPGIFSRLFAH